MVYVRVGLREAAGVQEQADIAEPDCELVAVTTQHNATQLPMLLFEP